MFVGHTGAGKTTHIRAAFSELKKEGYGVYKTHAKTVFLITMLLSALKLLQRITWRLAVALDLILNSILLPLKIWFRTVLVPLLIKKQVVLIEEHLLGSLVDYFHAALLLNLTSIALPTLRTLFMLSRISMWDAMVYVTCDKEFLSQRWAKRGTPPESRTYLLSQDFIFTILLKNISSNDVLYIDTTMEFNYNRHKVKKFILYKLRTSLGAR